MFLNFVNENLKESLKESPRPENRVSPSVDEDAFTEHQAQLMDENFHDDPKWNTIEVVVSDLEFTIYTEKMNDSQEERWI